MSVINPKNDFDVHCSLIFSLPPSDRPEKRAKAIVDAVHKLAERMGKMTFEDLKVSGAGTEMFFTEPVGRIYGTAGLSEHIEGAREVRVEVCPNSGRIRVIEE